MTLATVSAMCARTAAIPWLCLSRGSIASCSVAVAVRTFAMAFARASTLSPFGLPEPLAIDGWAVRGAGTIFGFHSWAHCRRGVSTIAVPPQRPHLPCPSTGQNSFPLHSIGRRWSGFFALWASTPRLSLTAARRAFLGAWVKGCGAPEACPLMPRPERQSSKPERS